MSVQLITSIDAMQATSQQWRQAGLRIAFVPTMGHLHAGHLQLVEQAKAHADKVVVSIFVNPLQFGPDEDFEQYARTLDDDIAALEGMSVDVVFAPDENAFYPKPSEQMSVVEVPVLSSILCGVSRPGHFRGVTTVVNKLFNIVQPDVAIFGTKDYQQLVIIQQMVADLSMPIRLLGVDTVREPDGLAMSSRNVYLSEAQRALAPALYKSLQTLREQILATEEDPASLVQAAQNQLVNDGFKVDYLAICDATTLQRLDAGSDNRVILIAAWLGETRLIDNILL